MFFKLDRAFILELQASGFDLDYKTLMQIYQRSRASSYEAMRRQILREMRASGLSSKARSASPSRR